MGLELVAEGILCEHDPDKTMQHEPIKAKELLEILLAKNKHIKPGGELPRSTYLKCCKMAIRKYYEPEACGDDEMRVDSK